MSIKASILFMIVFVLLFVSCAAPKAQAPAAEPPPLDKEPAEAPPDEALSDSAEPDQEDMLNPGDMIGEMEITTAEAWDWENNLFSLCVEGDAENEARREENRNVDEYPCDLYAGTQLIFNCIGVDEEPDDSLDERWSRLESEMILDGRPINLPAFGPLDFSSGDRALRIWNVLLKDMSSGDHTLVCRAEFDGVDYGETYYFTVSEPPKIEAPPDAKEMLFHGDSELFRTLDDFYVRLETALETNDLPHFWAGVDIIGESPLIFGDYAVFLYHGEGSSVQWKGLNFSKPYTRIGNSNKWLMVQQFEPDAILEYRIEIDGEGQMDPMNPLRIEAFSNNSLLQMPAFEVPEETLYREDIDHGDLTDNILISSEYLGYDKHYRVYTPPGYESQDALPVIYVSDGTDAINEVYLSMVNVLDNLIAGSRIKPVIAVFIAPHNAATDEYVRDVELDPFDMETCPFCDFVTEELVPLIDANYKTDPTAGSRALLGTSLGGRWASYMGLAHNDLFHLIGIQSHAVYVGHWLWDVYEETDTLPIKVFMHGGTYDIGTEQRLAELFDEKGVPYHYVENHGGHAHSSWRTTTDDALVYFFGIE